LKILSASLKVAALDVSFQVRNQLRLPFETGPICGKYLSNPFCLRQLAFRLFVGFG